MSINNQFGIFHSLKWPFNVLLPNANDHLLNTAFQALWGFADKGNKTSVSEQTSWWKFIIVILFRDWGVKREDELMVAEKENKGQTTSRVA